MFILFILKHHCWVFIIIMNNNDDVITIAEMEVGVGGLLKSNAVL